MVDLTRSGRTSLLLYLLITILVIALFLDGNQMFQSLELSVQDSMFRMRSERTPSGQVVICALDDVTVDRMGWPLKRDSLVRLLSDLKRAGARVVVCDFDWRDVAPPENPLADSIFWPVLATVIDNVVLPLHFTYADLGVSVPAPPRSYGSSTWTERFPAGTAVNAQALSGPESYLADSAMAVGGITPMLDKDRVVRFCPLLIDYGGSAFASNALWAASLYLDVARTSWWLEPGASIKIADHEVPTDDRGRLLLNFLGKAKTFKYVSGASVLDGEPSASLTDKVVVVSPTGLSGRVALTTRMSDDFLSGEVTATAIENIITGSYVEKPSYSALFDLLVMGLIGLFAAVVMPKVNLMYRFVILGATLFVIVNLQYLLFASFGWLTQAFYPALLVIFFMAVSPFMKSREEREKEALKGRRRAPHAAAVPAPAVGGAVPRYPISASESTGFAGADSTSRSAPGMTPGTEETAFADGAASAEAATSRLAGSSDPTRQVQPSAPDAPTRLVPTGAPELSASPESESLFLEEAPASGTPSGGVQPSEDSYATSRLESQMVPPQAQARTSHVAGEFLGRYRILEEIGRGAMGVVYRGIDPAINRPVALKTVRLDLAVPPAEKEELRSRLLREAQAAGQLSHPNIVTIYDVGSQGDVYYIAMEYLKGYTLERAVQKKLTLNYKIFAKLMIQVCDALEYAHSNELVHRDVKPANIMVLDNFKVKVMDFGIARVTNSNMTQTGVALGTPSYISPEQLSGHGVDRRSDIFSLGVVMYELLTKDKPFAGESINKLIFNILNSAPRRPTQLDVNIPEAFDRICLKALEKDPTKRYQYAADLSRDLKEFIASLQPRRMVI